MIDSYTNSSMTAFRRCTREFDLRYRHRLERSDGEREVLAVGSAWHAALEAATRAGDQMAGYEAINRHAPGALWREKLARMLSCYFWYYQERPLDIVEPEREFSYVDAAGHTRRGKMDGVIRLDSKLVAYYEVPPESVLEYKTTSEDIEGASDYWGELRMGTQVTFYGLAHEQATGRRPESTLYDVVRKPTIRPKAVTKKDLARLRAEVGESGAGLYFNEKFDSDEVEAAAHDGKETLRMYGARLTADIGDRPERYFQRRVISRTRKDHEDGEADTASTIAAMASLDSAHPMGGDGPAAGFPRNPNACKTYGTCDFFGLCSVGEYPSCGTAPSGFQIREQLHPELDTQ